MSNTLETIKELYATFEEDAVKAQNGNKSAGMRARKNSLKLDQLLKDFRKESLTWGK